MGEGKGGGDLGDYFTPSGHSGAGSNGNPVIKMVPRLRGDDVWFPAGACPVLDTGDDAWIPAGVYPAHDAGQE